jgi:hypothetical protein
VKILLDECLDRRLARELEGDARETRTVPQMGWASFKNGKLLALAAEKFDEFPTVDANLPHQQNLPKFNIAVVVLRPRSSKLADLKPLESPSTTKQITLGSPLAASRL